MRRDDRLLGRQVFFLTYALEGIFAPSQGDMVYVPDDGRGSHELNGGAVMRHVSMATFARFYVAGSSGREKIVENFHKGKGFDHYGPLKLLLRQYLKSGDMEGFRSASPNLNPKYRSRMADLERAKLDCIDLWGKPTG